MIRNKKRVSATGLTLLLLVLGNVITIIEAYTRNDKLYWLLVLTLPVLLLVIINVRRRKHALKQGVKVVGGAHNIGEGGISKFNLNGEDRIWQIGTDYLGCRDENGRFNAMAFRKNALHPQVKMIELKLSREGKNSPERHTEFDSPVGMVMFLDLLRELSGGKLVGFKICIVDRQEFIDICNAIKATGCIPDFITVDGENGHPEMPLHKALAFVKQTLDEFDLASHIKIIDTNFYNYQINIMQNKNKQLVLRKDDYNLLNSYLTGGHSRTAFDRRNAEELQAELKKAKLVNKDDFPPDVVRLNSTVRIKTEDRNDIMEFMLVTPDKANIKEKMISVMAPIGTALIGFRKGQKVKWHVPAGKKTFIILEVMNQ